MKISRGTPSEGLKIIGHNIDARNELIAALRHLESYLEASDLDVREYVTGPICDQIFDGAEIITKALADGTVISAPYTSKIIRDFVMAVPNPEFVWEPQTSRTLLHLSKNAKHVAIGGAYIGDHAVLVAKCIKDNGGIVHAFEPNEKSVEFLAINAKVNRLSNIRIYNSGLWSSTQSLKLEGYDSHASSAVSAATCGGITAQVLDQYCEEQDISSLDLIQLDVEGGELEILQGAQRLLSQPENDAPNLVFEIHASYVDWSNGLEATDVLKYIAAFGYEAYAIRDYHSNEELRSNIVELIPASTCYLEGPSHGFNMLAIKRSSIVEDPFFKIVDGVSPKLLKHRDPRYHAPLT